jgi:hypothetical protein
MTSANHSVRQGVDKLVNLGGRAVLLYLVTSLFSLSCLDSVHAAESGKKSGEANAAATETAAESAPALAEKERAITEIVIDNTVVAEPTVPKIRHIGPVTTITEVSSGLPFPARVDTGATTCSIHYEELEIEDAAESPEENIGKRVRILIKNTDGDKGWISTKIVDHVTVRTTTDDDDRYKVRLKLRWQDIEKHVLVTLKDREKMKYPLLVGRNFLRGDFLVDVNMAAEK